MSYNDIDKGKLNNLKSRDLIDIPCDHCNKLIPRMVKKVRRAIKDGNNYIFCDNTCQAKYVLNQRESCKCKQCNTEFVKNFKDQQYCSKQCACIHASRSTITIRSIKAKQQYIDNTSIRKTPTSPSNQYRQLYKKNKDLTNIVCSIRTCKCKGCGFVGSYRKQQWYCNDCKDLYAYNGRSAYVFTFNVYHYPDLFDLIFLETYGWRKTKGDNLNVNGVTRDHKVSVSDAIKNNYDPYYIKHPMNCELMLMSENQNKSTKSSISYEELVKLVDEYDSKHK